MRVTRSAFSAVPAIATAFAVSASPRRSAFAAPAAAAYDALRRVVESLRPYRRLVREPALHLVGDGERGQQLPSGGARVLGRREHRREVVARVAGLARREVGVVEVEVANERSVVERGAVGRGPRHRRSACRAGGRRSRPGRRGSLGRAARRAQPSAQPSASRTRIFSSSRARSERSSHDRSTTKRASRAATVKKSAYLSAGPPRARPRRCAQCRAPRRRASASASRARRRSSRSFSSCAPSSSV